MALIDSEKEYNLKSSDKVEGIKDDQFFRIADELAGIQRAPTMYISSDGDRGGMHLEKEIFNNALDECNNDNPHWNNHKKEITLEFYESERRFVTTDGGRGLPLDIMEDAILHKHVSTKIVGISDIRNKKLAGLNGRI